MVGALRSAIPAFTRWFYSELANTIHQLRLHPSETIPYFRAPRFAITQRRSDARVLAKYLVMLSADAIACLITLDWIHVYEGTSMKLYLVGDELQKEISELEKGYRP
jgi:hypothetical protein